MTGSETTDILPQQSREDAFPDSFETEFALVQRLNTTVFLKLEQAMKAIQDVMKHIPNGSELGNFHLAYPTVGFKSYLGYKDVRHEAAYVPDRLATSSCGQVARCPGIVRCSWRFQASWREKDTTTAQKKEYRIVMETLWYHMLNLIGSSSPGVRHISARYGYIVTDQEVVLVKREQDDDGKVIMYATDGFPLRGEPQNQLGWNGLMALLIIHLLVSWDEQYYITP